MKPLAAILAAFLCLAASADDLYFEAFSALRFPASPEQVRALQDAVLRGWPAGGDEPLRALAFINARSLAAMRTAAEGEPPPPFPQPAERAFDAHAPHLDLSLRLAWIGLLEARRLQRDGHSMEAGRACVAVAALGWQAAAGGPLAARRAAGTILDMAGQVLGDLAPCIAQAELDANVRPGQRTVDALAALARRETPLADALRREKGALEAALPLAAALAGREPAQAFERIGLEYREGMDEGAAQALRAFVGQPAEGLPAVRRFGELARLAEGPLHALLASPALSPGEEDHANALTRRLLQQARTSICIAEAGRARLLAAQVALAAAEARAKGRMARALGVLLDGVLDPVPDDPFTGFAFRYVPLDAGFAVYSHGPDGADGRARRDWVPGAERGDVAVWSPLRTRFAWRTLQPALDRWAQEGELQWAQWDARRAHLVFVAAGDVLAVGDARAGTLRSHSREAFDDAPFEARGMAFGPDEAWLATSSGLFAYDPQGERWRRMPVAQEERPDCLAVRMEGESRLGVLLGPTVEPQAFVLDLETGEWRRAAREVAEIWAGGMF